MTKEGKLLWKNKTLETWSGMVAEGKLRADEYVSYMCAWDLFYLCPKCSKEHPIASLSMDTSENHSITTFIVPCFIEIECLGTPLEEMKRRAVAFFNISMGQNLKAEDVHADSQTPH